MEIRIGQGLLAGLTVVAAPADEGLNLDRAAASRFARIALACVGREYPNKPDHVMNAAADAQGPKAFHPAFFGCFDWHSSVHGHWMLLRLLRQFPDLPEAPEIQNVLDAHLAPGPMAVEVAYLEAPGRKSFERTYGWAWLLKLAADLRAWDDPRARTWAAGLRPLSDRIAKAFGEFLPRLTYPIRSGVHPNTAYSLSLALDYAEAAQDADLAKLIRARSRVWFAADRDCPLAYEPSGEDFLSGCLEEAALMRRVLPDPAAFRAWLPRFAPSLFAKDGLPPAVVSDRTDPRIVHLDGLNLSRARALYGIASGLEAQDPRRAALVALADRHARASLPHIASGNYEGEHWLATFAVHMLQARSGSMRPE